MGMTMSQKILAKHADLDYVEAGQLIEAKLDLVLGNDITSPVAIKEMDKFKHTGVFAEQAANWEWLLEKVKGESKKYKNDTIKPTRVEINRFLSDFLKSVKS